MNKTQSNIIRVTSASELFSKYYRNNPQKYPDISLEVIKIPVIAFQSTIRSLFIKMSIVPGNGKSM